MRSRAFVAAAVLGGALVSGGWLLQRGLERGDSVYSRARLFDDVFTRVATLYVDSLPRDDLYAKAVAGMLDELGDPYSVFLVPERLSKLNENTSGTYGGLGIQIDVRDGFIIVIAPLPGTPAERAGIQSGDRIITIDGRPTEGFTADEAMNALRGRRGSRVALLVERPGVTERLPFLITRAEIRNHPVRYSMMLDEGVGYVDVRLFSEATAEELRDAVTQLRDRGMRTLIMDLRSNPGGLLEQGIAVSDLFLDRGQRVVSMKGRAYGATREFRDGAPQPWPDLPIVVLVNEHSASASEIVAGALQDHDRALIIGQTTYGKGSAQSVYHLGEDGALKLTTARWYTPVGRSIQKELSDTSSGNDDDEDSAEEDGQEPLAKRKPFRTDGGRVVYGSGGITPDLFVAPQPIVTDGTLWRALGRDIPRFRDAITDYAVAVKVTGRVRSRDFSVTPDMREALWQRLQPRGITVSRTTYDSAHATINRLLGNEIARYVFGPEAEYRRQIREDRLIATALELAANRPSQSELFRRAAERREAKREDAPADQ
jgi:carboxyl-terminal processing protease